jgi:hypothetical protein
MSKCAVQRGILALRDCGQEGINTCGVCARPVCAEHTRLRSGDTICVECFAKGEEEALHEQTTAKKSGAKAPPVRPVAENDEEWNDPDWAYRYRHYYYSSSNYQPFYDGYDDYYSGYDIRSFHRTWDERPDDESATDAGGFHDS